VPLVVVAFRTIFDCVKLQVSPVDGETLWERATVPENPSSSVTVTVEVPAAPARTVRLVGDVVIVKS
jgi:hypothetical protein